VPTPDWSSFASRVTVAGLGCQSSAGPTARSAVVVTGAVVSICGVRVFGASLLPALSVDQ